MKDETIVVIATAMEAASKHSSEIKRLWDIVADTTVTDDEGAEAAASLCRHGLALSHCFDLIQAVTSRGN